ncbi:PTS lactose/cellobiose transporter subunit IIA [Clostridium intestinale]|uniref:PTS system lactose/cellobiose-specific transporter subunit IIA n=1 Tax=Clostridium intestinale URNW TaxID=1294142 RepID=U2N8M9_9CLOT|nr:PTS lactose/cellobiose transporter subunit IIA [Clostridium intestinale]ERK31877.1 PTS system lactose/cellobiose-specific transporter subunit IIA [Clostridium intestinale URNW]
MDGMELIAFNIISNVGTAKSMGIQALIKGREGKKEEADKLLEDASSFLKEGHKSHAELIQEEAKGNKQELSLILMHAEDQLMASEIILSLAKEMLYMQKEINDLKKK